MSHKSGHIIIKVAMPHGPSLAEVEEPEMARGPAIAIDLEEGCTEDECVQKARRAYRRLMRVAPEE